MIFLQSLSFKILVGSLIVIGIITILEEIFIKPKSKDKNKTHNVKQKAPKIKQKTQKFDRLNKIKGDKGELEIEEEIIRNFKEVTHIFKNVKVPKENGEISETDLLLLSDKGIFVIESKNYGGLIYGSEDDYKWTQFFNRNSKYHFYNPIKQNNNHIKYLKEFLGKNFQDDLFKSIIVFGNGCKLQKVNYTKSDNITVCNTLDSSEEIKRIYENSKSNLTQEQIEYIVLRLKEFENTVTNKSEFMEFV